MFIETQPQTTHTQFF